MAHLSATFFDELRAVYDANATAREYWPSEEPVLRLLVPQVAEKLAFNYAIVEPFAIGGSGIVIFVEDQNLKLTRALKISRPSPGKERYLARVLFRETQALLRLSHQNLIRIFAQGVVTLEMTHSLSARVDTNESIPVESGSPDRQDFPFYVMEYVKDAVDSDKYLRKPNLAHAEIMNVFGGMLAAFSYMHSQDEIHMDIKPGNVLVTPSAIPIVSDLGFAKKLRADDDYTIIGGTEGYIHPEARTFVTTAISDPNRLQGETPHSILKPAWDLYSLGRTFLTLLGEIEQHNPAVLSVYERRYLHLVACRLLDGQKTGARVPGLSDTTLAEIKYSSIDEARVDFDKLTGLYDIGDRIPELSEHTQDTIQASPVSVTPFTPRVKATVETPAVLRLGAITQLGLLNLIYPTANHTRLEHSIGTFSLCCRYVLALYHDAYNPLFRQVMTEHDIKAVLLAALLHDVGQSPMAHDIEEADPDFYSHEVVAIEILRDRSNELWNILASAQAWDVDPEHVVAILDANLSRYKGTLKERILHSLISGCIDCDKLDYIMRDGTNLGVPFGYGIDIERLLRCLTVVFREEGDKTYASLGIHEKGKVPAESVAFARYAMFGQVYWHHAYRAIKAMLHRMLLELNCMCPDEGARTRAKQEFHRFVKPAPGATVGQQRLFELMDNVADAPIGVNIIQQGDFAVLEWIAKRSGNIGTAFLGLLRSRRLYKRVLVLSRDKAADDDLVGSLYEFQRNNRKHWEKRLRLQVLLQEKVKLKVEEKVAVPTSAPIEADARNRFLSEAETLPLVLIDIPQEKGASDQGLEYLIEEDRHKHKIGQPQSRNLEASLVWKSLQKSFRDSAGKIRIFCHPQHSDFLSAALSREEMEDALRSSLTQIEQ